LHTLHLQDKISLLVCEIHDYRARLTVPFDQELIPPILVVHRQKGAQSCIQQARSVKYIVSGCGIEADETQGQMLQYEYHQGHQYNDQTKAKTEYPDLFVNRLLYQK
jgi:hypothetical protein